MAVNVVYTWNGDKIKRRLDAANRAAVDATNEEAAAVASGLSPVDTGRLRDSMESKPAVKRGGAWVGEFGSYGVDYAIFVESGTRYMRGHFMIRTAADRVLPSYPARLIDEIGGL